MDSSSKYHPIEITTHNMYFHEESPIFSIDHYNNLMATSGSDNTVRIWRLELDRINYKENTYRKIQDSSISIHYLEDLKGFNKSINCVRFYKSDTLKHKGAYLLAGSSDGGKVILFNSNKAYTVRADNGDDAYELSWFENKLIVGFSSGNIEVYKIEIIDNIEKDSFESSIKTTLCFSKKIHSGTIQGITVFKNQIATHSLDGTVKVHNIIDDDFQLVSSLFNKIDLSRGLFKRILLWENLLYTFNKQNHVCVFTGSYSEENIVKKIGPLNSSVVKIIRDGDLIIICTKKSVYILENDYTVCCVDNACYMAITDAFFYLNTVFVCAMDGFITTIRLSNK